MVRNLISKGKRTGSEILADSKDKEVRKIGRDIKLNTPNTLLQTPQGIIIKRKEIGGSGFGQLLNACPSEKNKSSHVVRKCEVKNFATM